MPRPIIIIGGGLLGVSALYELQAAGQEVILIEAAPALASGASHANGGVLHPSVSNPWNALGSFKGLRISPQQLPHLSGWGIKFLRYATPTQIKKTTANNYALAAYSTQCTRQLIEEHALDIEQKDAGMIKICASPRALRRAIDLAPPTLDYDLPTPDELAERDPALAHAPPAHAIHYKGDMIGNAHAFTMQLAAVAQSKGAQIILNKRVDSLLTHNNKIEGVRCGTEEIKGDVIVAGGYESVRLLKPLGLNLPVQPVKGYSLTFDCGGKTIPRYPLVDDTRHIALTPFHNKIRVLGMAEFTGEDKTIPPKRLAHLEKFLRQRYPHLHLTNPQGWAGLRPMSADGRPYIGAAPIKGLWLLCGHGHLGWTMAVGSARLLAAQMTDTPITSPITNPTINPQAFSYQRK